MPVSTSSHPLVAMKLSQLRNKHTSPKEFRSLLKELSSLLGVEASASLPLRDVPNLQSPMATYTGKELASRVGLTPILRAGIGMTDAFLDLFPSAQVFYLGLFREKVSLSPVEYYQKLPQQVTVDTLYLLDPLIATGGTAIAALQILQDWGLDVKQIKLVSVLASRAGLEKVAEAYPELEVYVGAVDEQLTSDGYLIPGVGDTGDRLFNTL
ncbi:hypothetical protein JCM10207_008564 [Rhodosporidiobolus poonsookiae]